MISWTGPHGVSFLLHNKQAYFLTAEHKACISKPIRSGLEGD